MPPPLFNVAFGLHNVEESTAESSSSSVSRGERSSGVVPVWSPSNTTFADQFMSDEAAIGPSSAFLQRHPQSHQMLNWRRLSQTGWALNLKPITYNCQGRSSFQGMIMVCVILVFHPFCKFLYAWIQYSMFTHWISIRSHLHIILCLIFLSRSIPENNSGQR